MKKVLLLLVSFLILTSASPQKSLKKVKLDFLKGEKELNIVFDYSGTIFKAEDGKDESIYVEKQTITEGEQWIEYWNSLKDTIKAGSFYPKFIKDFNLKLLGENCRLRGGNFPQGNYTAHIIIKVICTGGVPFDKPYIVSDIIFTKTGSEEIIAQFWLQTDGNSFSNTMGRVESAHERFGKYLAEIIEKKIR